MITKKSKRSRKKFIPPLLGLIVALFPFDIPSLPLYPNRDVKTLSILMCSECKGCPRSERVAVAHVVLNRADRPGWWGSSLQDVITKPGQFAQITNVPLCRWNLPARQDGKDWSPFWVTHHRKILLEIREDAISVVGGKLPDPTDGATYFHARRLGRLWPHLAEVEVPRGWYHRFYTSKKN